MALLSPPNWPVQLLGSLLLFGVYYACTDGVLPALASAVLPVETRSTGLALLGTGTALSRLAGSVLFGALWTAAGLEPAVLVFLGGLAFAVGLLAVGLARTSAS